jgi:hypothetical protein
VFSGIYSNFECKDYRKRFWSDVHRFLQYRHGRFFLSYKGHASPSTADDAIAFLMGCPGEDFLDFIEYIFRVDCFFHVTQSDKQLIEELNELLRSDNLPYYLSDFVKETVREPCHEYPFAGREMTVVKTIAYPTILMRESDVIHSQVIEPALQLLQESRFRSANLEFLGALEDYRRGDLGDCLTKCGSAFESVLKLLCEERKWPYKQNDTANSLVKLALSKTTLENYFEPVLMISSTLRNRLSSAHGAGSGAREVPRHIALYSINVTASAILLLVDAARSQP